jgi:oligoribonuclease (3'-5' exoribonuclease)
MNLVSVDIETTGLDPRTHEAWEVAIVQEDGSWHLFDLPVHRLQHAESGALRINEFYGRRLAGPNDPDDDTQVAFRSFAMPYHGENERPLGEDEAWAHIAELLAGATPMGCSVHFDMEFIAEGLRRHGLAPAWHHRFLDLGSFAAGVWNEPGPIGGGSMIQKRPEVKNEAVHTALADAQWNWAMYRQLRDEQQKAASILGHHVGGEVTAA